MVACLVARMRHRVAVAVLILVVVLPLLAWTATFLYWHVRLKSCVRTLESQRLQGGERTEQLSYAAGVLMHVDCRAMPYLIADMDPTDHWEFLNAASYLVSRQSLQVETRGGEAEWKEREARVLAWQVLPADSPALRRTRIDLMRTWWQHHRSKHPWWRVWASTCVSE
jgi:hypothetical protein